VWRRARLSFDYQFVDNPAYDRDPVSIGAVRLPTAF
jgi:hypothetical protein